MNRLMVLDEHGEIDVFQNDSLEVLYECIELYPKSMYFFAHVELVVSEFRENDNIDPMTLIHSIVVYKFCTVLSFKNGTQICSHCSLGGVNGYHLFPRSRGWDEVPSFRTGV